MTLPAIDARDIRVAYGATAVLRGVTFQVPWGARVALLGANGAGKSTLLRVLTGTTRPDGGTVALAGCASNRDWARARRSIGAVAHQTFLYDELTAKENLEFFAELYDVRRASVRVAELLFMVGLKEKANTRARFLSRGQQQRLTLARALVHDPRLLVLDEPDTGLDLAASDLLSTVFAPHRTLVLATHNLELAGRLCQRYLLLSRGRLVAQGRMAGVAELRKLLRSASDAAAGDIQ